MMTLSERLSPRPTTVYILKCREISKSTGSTVEDTYPRAIWQITNNYSRLGDLRGTKFDLRIGSETCDTISFFTFNHTYAAQVTRPNNFKLAHISMNLLSWASWCCLLTSFHQTCASKSASSFSTLAWWLWGFSRYYISLYCMSLFSFACFGPVIHWGGTNYSGGPVSGVKQVRLEGTKGLLIKDFTKYRLGGYGSSHICLDQHSPLYPPGNIYSFWGH